MGERQGEREGGGTDRERRENYGNRLSFGREPVGEEEHKKGKRKPKTFPAHAFFASLASSSRRARRPLSSCSIFRNSPAWREGGEERRGERRAKRGREGVRGVREMDRERDGDRKERETMTHGK